MILIYNHKIWIDIKNHVKKFIKGCKMVIVSVPRKREKWPGAVFEKKVAYHLSVTSFRRYDKCTMS